MNTRYTFVLIGILTLAIVGGTAITSAQPEEPANFYGEVVDQDGSPAPVGTDIIAVVDGEVRDTITVEDAGQYGEEGAFGEKLVVNSGAGETVQFHVGSPDGPEAIESPRELEGGTFEFNLTFPAGTFDTEPAVDSISIAVGDDTVEVGDSTGIEVTATLEDGSTVDVSEQADIETRDPNTARVDGTTVTGEREGTVTIEATYTDQGTTESDTITLTVNAQEEPSELQSITLTTGINGTTIVDGETAGVTVTATFADGSTEELTESAQIESSNATIASVSGTTVTGDTAGTVTITATVTEDGVTESAAIELTVETRENENNDTTGPRELTDDEIADRFVLAEEQAPARAIANELSETAGREGSEVVFGNTTIMESIQINTNLTETVAIAEYDTEVATLPSPGTVVSTIEVSAPASVMETDGVLAARIPVDRIEEIGATPSEIQVFQILNGTQQSVPTDVREQTDEAVRIEAAPSSFSMFVISVVSEPVAAFNVTPAQPVAGDEITLDATSVTDEYGVIEEYEWELTSETISNRTLAGAEATTVIEQPGEYEIRLVVENDAGQTSSETTTVTVQQTEPSRTGLSVTVGSETLTTGETTGITVMAEFDDGSTVDVTDQVTIESTNTTVARIDGTTVIAEGAGNVDITATIDDETVTQSLTVTETGDGNGDNRSNGSDASNDDGIGPGFGIISAVVAGIVISYAQRRRE